MWRLVSSTPGQTSHLTNCIRLAAGTKSLPNEVHDVYDKVADKIRSNSVKDLSINTLDKAAKYSLDLLSVFESKKSNPVVKKMFDPAFKKKYQKENNLRVLRTNITVFPQHALVVSIHILYDIYVYLLYVYLFWM